MIRGDMGSHGQLNEKMDVQLREVSKRIIEQKPNVSDLL